MNGSVRMGQIFGVPLRIHWSTPVLVVLLGYGLGRQTLPSWAPGRSSVLYAVAATAGTVLLLVSLLLHEAAHAATARRKGVPVRDVTLWAMGGMTRMDRPDTARVALAVAASGPVTSLVLGGTALGVGIGVHTALGWEVPAAILVWLGWANLLLGVFNLLPAAPLDGGRVVQALLWWRTGDRDRAELAAGRSGQVIGALLMVVGWVFFLHGAPGGLWLALIGLFITITAGAERQRAALHTALRGVRVADAMSSPVITGADWLSVQRFIDEVAAHTRRTALPLLDADGRPTGIVTMRQLAAVPAARRVTMRVREAATPLSRCTLTAPHDLLTDALDRLRPGAGPRILVTADGRLEGIVTAHDIARLVRHLTPRRERG